MSSELKSIWNKLIKYSQSWALSQGFDPEQAKELRRQAILINHQNYLKTIPFYRKLAQEEGCNENIDLNIIKQKLILPEDIFKSYSQEWLDNNNYTAMNKWLSSLYCQNVEVDVTRVCSIDDWISRLDEAGIEISCSSGTSGTISFVPRSTANWETIRIANKSFITPFLIQRKVSTPIAGYLTKPAMKLLSSEAFTKIVNKVGLKDFDGIFLGFSSGKTGNQVLMKTLSPMFRRHYFLYDLDLSMNALRCFRRGARNEDENILLEKFRIEVNQRRDENYLKIVDHLIESTREGQKIFMFGAPYQLKELCDFMTSQNQKVTLNKESLIIFGGGWKSFTGESMDRESFFKMLSASFELTQDRIIEWYSMTEINALMMRCQAGRFHIPPLLEPVIFDEELNPLEGDDLSGTFGFLDPLAYSYPGFIISGDHVHLVEGKCSCGLMGPAVTEIKRARNREVKGCGGIMSSIRA
jgi:hypothetical protein